MLLSSVFSDLGNGLSYQCKNQDKKPINRVTQILLYIYLCLERLLRSYCKMLSSVSMVRLWLICILYTLYAVNPCYF